MSKNPKVAIVIVTWNKKSYVMELLTITKHQSGVKRFLYILNMLRGTGKGVVYSLLSVLNTTAKLLFYGPLDFVRGKFYKSGLSVKTADSPDPESTIIPSYRNNPEYLNPYDPQKYWENRLKSRFDIVAVGHPTFNRMYNEYLYKLQLLVLKDALRKHGISLNGKIVLDIGCGTGFFFRFYLENSAQITGIDITTTSIESLRKSLPDGKFITMDISAELPANKDYFANQFDIINMLNVIFHVVDDVKFERALENLAACLKEGGYLLISDYFGDEDIFPAPNTKLRGLKRYKTLEQKGVKILEIIPIYFFMNMRLDLLPYTINNLISPLLFAFDYIITKLRWPKGNNIKLLIGRKQS